MRNKFVIEIKTIYVYSFGVPYMVVEMWETLPMETFRCLFMKKKIDHFNSMVIFVLMLMHKQAPK